MTKSQLIARLVERWAAENPGLERELRYNEMELAVTTVFEEIARALEQGRRVELRGFGAMAVKHRTARTGRNPRTGEPVSVEAKAVPFFKTSKLLHTRLNGG